MLNSRSWTRPGRTIGAPRPARTARPGVGPAALLGTMGGPSAGLLAQLAPMGALLAALLPPAAGAASHLVRPDGSGDFPTIQAAITAAVPADTVLLADGVFRGAGNRDLDPAGKAIVIRAQSGQAEACVLDCEGGPELRRRGFVFQTGEGPATRLENLTICNGWGPDDLYGMSEAGGVLIRDAAPVLSGCILSMNHADFGAAVMLYGHAAPTIRACMFDYNLAALDAGGIDCRDQAHPLVADCLFTGNQAGNRAGGLLADDDATPLVQGCTFTGNYAAYGGAAVYGCGLSRLVVDGCTIESNATAVGGAGIAGGCYGDILVARTIVAFSAAGSAVSLVNNAHITLQCCDLYGNAGGDWIGPIAGQYGENGNFAEDPLFCDRTEGDLRLGGESPCLPRHHPWGDACGVIGAWPVGCPGSGVPEPGGAPRLQIREICPNPSSGATCLRFAVGSDGGGALTLRVHDAAGRLVRTLPAGSPGAGEHEIVWDGADDAGDPVSAGLYWCRLIQGEHLSTRSILRVR